MKKKNWLFLFIEKQGFQYLKYMYVEDHKKIVSKEK